MTPAERYARQLVFEHGTVEARRIIRAKLETATDLNDRRFYVAVLEALR